MSGHMAHAKCSGPGPRWNTNRKDTDASRQADTKNIKKRYASVVSPAAAPFYFYKSFRTVRQIQALETPQLDFRELMAANPVEPDLALHQSLRDLLRNLLRNPVEPDLAQALHQSLPHLLRNSRTLLNLTWLCTKASGTFSGTFSGTLLNLTWLCTKASHTFSGTFSGTLLNLT